MTPIFKTAALAGLSILLLTGCQSSKIKALCPTASILADTATLTTFKSGMQGDPAGELFSIQILSVKPSCSVDTDEGTTESSLDITFRATRAPTGGVANFTAPYYIVSVLDGTSILDKKMLATAFAFQPGEATITFTESVPSVLIKLENGKKPYEYSLLVGLQLTREQLDYARKHGRYAP
jgi:hypothetical protein